MDIEMVKTVEYRAARTDIAFDCLLHVFDKQVEILDTNSHYAVTFGFQGDFQQEIDEAETQFTDYDWLIEQIKKFDPEFPITEEFYVSGIGCYLERQETEGSYEEGYYEILILDPEFIAFEPIPKEAIDEFLKEMEENAESISKMFSELTGGKCDPK